jgi:hypothetical protein
MNYREHYAKREAVHMYARGHDREEVITMLKQEGAGDPAGELADSYKDDSK